METPQTRAQNAAERARTAATETADRHAAAREDGLEEEEIGALGTLAAEADAHATAAEIAAATAGGPEAPEAARGRAASRAEAAATAAEAAATDARDADLEARGWTLEEPAE